MDLGISGKRALVTGGINGIGGGISRGLLSQGCYVFATTRREADGAEFLSGLSADERNRFEVWLGDVSSEDECARLIAEFRKKPENFDILVNNAGHTLSITDPFCSLESWKSVMRLNFELAVQLVNQLAPAMITRGWGRIVNISSCAGLENSGPVTFSTAKAALTAYTRSMGRVLATMGGAVVMTALYPGVIETVGGHWEEVRRTDPERVTRYIEQRCPLGRFGSIDEFVPTVLFFCSQHASFAHGSIVGIDGGQSKHYNYNIYLD